MREKVAVVTELVVIVIDALALVIIVVGTTESFVRVLRLMLRSGSDQDRREVWLRQARWLVAGLTVQLAADIIETAASTSWEAIGRTAAVAVLRTFLNFFLERDIAEVRALQQSKEEDVGAM
jgi:uncharacterized membrane protein